MAFFFAGFIFDAFLLHRPDTVLQIAHQALYLFLLTLLLSAAILENYGLFSVSPRFKKIWHYHEHLTQFLLGTLLNVYAFFYFKSASLLSSIVFMLVVGGLLVANDFVKLKDHQITLKLVLYFLCITSFWLYVVPMMIGYVGIVSFILALVVSNGFIYAIYGIAGRTATDKGASMEAKRSIQKKILGSGYGVLTAFALFYALAIIPPVPLSLQYMGIFHEVRKENGEFILSHSRPFWKFWQNGDQTFLARPGDSVVAFVRVFAPRGFQDQLFVRWMLDTPRGWEKQDLIPITVNGGREEGFRGYTAKANYQPGLYRVQIVTTDGREVGRISLSIKPDESTEPRVYQELHQ